MAIDENKQKALAAALAKLKSNLVKVPLCVLVKTALWMLKLSQQAPYPLMLHWVLVASPLGRIVEIYGPESSGKNNTNSGVIAAAQRSGKTCAFIDAEHALDPIYAKN